MLTPSCDQARVIDEIYWRGRGVIDNFTFQNFKSIKSLSLQMRPFMVLVGPNGAGKTNIVRAMELYGRILRAGTIDPLREAGYDQVIRRENKPARGGLHLEASHTIAPKLFERIANQTFRHNINKRVLPLFLTVRGGLTVTGSVANGELKITSETLDLTSNNGIARASYDGRKFSFVSSNDEFLDAALRFTLGLRTDEMQMNLSLEEEVKRTADPERQSLRLLNWQRSPSVVLRELRNHSSVFRLRLESSALRQESVLEEQSRERLLGPSGEGLAAAVYRMRGDGITPRPEFDPILAALRDVYPRIEDIRTERTGTGRLYLVFKERGIAQDLGQSNVSDGVMHALALLLALHGGLGGQGILVIEEPENAIHPWSLRAMIERAQQAKDRQIILTTHSEIVVNEVQEPESLWVVEVNDAGTTALPAIEREVALKSIMEKTGEKLGDIWLDGTLGGIPGVDP